MARGGKREGAGRPGLPGSTRSLRLPDVLWEAIDAAAEADTMSSNAKAREWLQLAAAEAAANRRDEK